MRESKRSIGATWKAIMHYATYGEVARETWGQKEKRERIADIRLSLSGASVFSTPPTPPPCKVVKLEYDISIGALISACPPVSPVTIMRIRQHSPLSRIRYIFFFRKKARKTTSISSAVMCHDIVLLISKLLCNSWKLSDMCHL